MVHYAYFIGDGFASLVCLVVGIRMCALGAQSGQLSDRLLSASFLLWAFCYLVYDIPYSILGDAALVSPLFLLSSMVALHLGTITFTVFIRIIFRNKERWAVRLLGITAGCLIVGVIGSICVGDWGAEDPFGHPWWWFIRVGSVAPYVWMGTEGIAQYLKARRRRELGLCAPQVCNRYLLWGLAGALWVVVELVDVAQYVVYASTGAWSDTLTLLVACSEGVPGVIIWLVFFPPAFYRRWIEGAAAKSAAVEG